MPPPAVPSFPPGTSEDPDVKAVVAAAAYLSKIEAASGNELEARRALARRVRAFLGEALEKEALAAALGGLLKELKQLDSLPEERATELKSVVTALKKAAVVEPLEAMDRLVARDASLWQRIVSLGRNAEDSARLAATERVLVRVDVFLQEHERRFTGPATLDPLEEALAAHEKHLGVAGELISVLVPSAKDPEGT